MFAEGPRAIPLAWKQSCFLMPWNVLLELRQFRGGTVLLSREECMVASDGAGVTHLGGNHFFLHGTSHVMRDLERKLTDIARTNVPVLLQGESGTGKEMVALLIHNLSARREESFLKLSCALASEAFGKQFPSNGPGHSPKRPVTVGTALLDEVGELDAACQSKLLHMVRDGEGLSLGNFPAARLVSSTRRNLESEVGTGVFREELYYRINGVRLLLPPLRERREDIPALVCFLLRKHAASYNRAIPPVGPEVQAALQEHSWPGNIRQLENVVRRIVIFRDAQAALADLHAPLPEAGSTPRANNGSCSLKDVSRAASRKAERELILKTLMRTRWNRKRAAQELQISYKALLYKLKELSLDPAAKPEVC